MAPGFKLEGVQEHRSVCPYCAVGCGLVVHVRGKTIVNVEGDPESPINEGTLCPKGAAAFQLAVNPLRQTKVLYRRPHHGAWETRSLDWAMDAIADRLTATRDATFVEQSGGMKVMRTDAVFCLGGAVFDNEENYLLTKLMRGLGVTAVENQARV